MANTHWLDLVKKAAVQAVMAQKPCDYVIGTVVSSKPLKIKLSDGDGLELTADFIHLTETVNASTKKGDKVVMIRKWGGQDYIVIDKVVE